MQAEKIVEQIQQLKKALEEIEKRLTAGDVPRGVMEDFKMAVDHTRMTVWALLSTPQSDQDALAAAIIRFRLKRAIEMCRQIVLDIESSEVTVASPELQEFHVHLKSTLDRIERLYKTGV